jgi:hypothetical protein
LRGFSCRHGDGPPAQPRRKMRDADTGTGLR